MSRTNKLHFIEAMLNWFASPSMDRELDVKFLSDTYDEITAPAWVSVEKELPPKRKDPLVISNEVFIRTTGGHYLSAVYDYQDKQWIDVYNIETLESNKVTNWMQITPPVKKGVNDEAAK